jgi:hypothetical protein
MEFLNKANYQPNYLLKVLVGGKTFTHSIGDQKISVSFKVDKGVLSDFGFKADEELIYLVDSYFRLIHGKKIENVKSLTAKEFDYFLKDNPTQRLFNFYPQYLFEILSIGESIYNIVNSEEKPLYNGTFGAFKELPYGEQLEVLEDVISSLFPAKDLTKLQFDYPQLDFDLSSEEFERIKFHLSDSDLTIKNF